MPPVMTGAFIFQFVSYIGFGLGDDQFLVILLHYTPYTPFLNGKRRENSGPDSFQFKYTVNLGEPQDGTAVSDFNLDVEDPFAVALQITSAWQKYIR
ncbi:hypothetical protein PbDSM24746_58660 [Paenibacillus macerans]|nr:hypothetical protein PbDSM24746_58660 [Paenibacillus macerans]GBK72192.1 hypothetical protein PbJCM17693_59000 [Paenibacillus macerans]GIP13811.1 hypothetical protein J1TS5_59810 [Paenibacillus macerans]